MSNRRLDKHLDEIERKHDPAGDSILDEFRDRGFGRPIDGDFGFDGSAELDEDFDPDDRDDDPLGPLI